MATPYVTDETPLPPVVEYAIYWVGFIFGLLGLLIGVLVSLCARDR